MVTVALLWIAWCTLHSLLITGSLNRWIRNKGGLLQGVCRIAYILFSCLSLAPVLWFQYTQPQQLIFSWNGLWRIPQATLLLYAFIMFYSGKHAYDTDYFLGLRQWRDYRLNRETTPKPFTCEGILRYVRHPWYSGGLALIWVFGPITDVTALVRTILTLYFIIGTLLEERKLVRELGEPYRNYCRQVPMLIPWRGRVRVESIKNSSTGHPSFSS